MTNTGDSVVGLGVDPGELGATPLVPRDVTLRSLYLNSVRVSHSGVTREESFVKLGVPGPYDPDTTHPVGVS